MLYMGARMRARLASAVAATAALALAAAGLVAVAGTASAYIGAPPWAGSDGGSKGALALYDPSGNKLTGGTDINTLAAYVQASGARFGAIKAALSIAFPDHANGIPATWFEAPLQGSTTFSPAPAGTPPVVSAGGVAFVKTAFTGTLVEDAISAGVLDITGGAAYLNVIELRVRDSGPTVAADGNRYWSDQIEFNPTTATAPHDGLAPGAWRVVGGNVAPLPTTTSVTATPVSGAANNEQNIVLTATISTNTGGTVAFTVDGLPFDGVQPVSGAGSYNSSSSTLNPGTHTVTATFTPGTPPTNQAGYAASAGSIASYVVNQITHPTTTNVSGTDPVEQGSVFMANATVTNNDNFSTVTTGAVVFTIDGLVVGTDSSLSNGATLHYVIPTSMPAGSHVLIASFIDGIHFLSSASPPLQFEVTAPQYTPDPQDVSTVINPGTITISTPYHGDTGYCEIVTTFSSPNKGKLVYTPAAVGHVPGAVAGALLPGVTGGAAGQQDSHECGYLFLPAMVLNGAATQYSTSGTFDDIVVTDTRPGNNAYTVIALASSFTNPAGTGSTYTIASTNVGFTGLTQDSIHAVNTSFGLTGTGVYNFTTFDRPASPGIGGAGQTILHAGIGLGDVTMHGTLSIQAPTTMRDGVYRGTVTFSVLGT